MPDNEHQDCDFLNGITFLDIKPYNKFNMVQDYFTPQRITGTVNKQVYIKSENGIL